MRFPATLGRNIQSRMESSGTTSPVNTVLQAFAEQGFGSFRHGDIATANFRGATKSIINNASVSQAGYVGFEAIRPGATAPIGNVAGIQDKVLLTTTEELIELQTYGYAAVASVATSTAAGGVLVATSGSSQLTTQVAFAAGARICATALSAEASNLAAVWLYCL